VAKFTQGAADAELFGLRFRPTVPRPPVAVGTFMYFISQGVIGFDAHPTIAAHLTAMRVPPLDPYFTALTLLRGLVSLGFAVRRAAGSTACREGCSTAVAGFKLMFGLLSATALAYPMPLLGSPLRLLPAFSIDFLGVIAVMLALSKSTHCLPLAVLNRAQHSGLNLRHCVSFNVLARVYIGRLFLINYVLSL